MMMCDWWHVGLEAATRGPGICPRGCVEMADGGPKLLPVEDFVQ